MQKKLIELIEKYQKDNDFTGGIKDSKIINDAQNLLGIELPEQYRWFLETYGSGGIAWVEVFGIYKDNLEFVDETLHYRERGLPHNLVVLQNSDEWVECIDTDNGNIVTWSMYDKDGVIYAYNSFYEYLIDSFQEAIDNL